MPIETQTNFLVFGSLSLQNLKSPRLPYDIAVSNMNKSDKKVNEKTALKTIPANTKVLPFDDGSKIKKK
jgi:hypothetical protein